MRQLSGKNCLAAFFLVAAFRCLAGPSGLWGGGPQRCHGNVSRGEGGQGCDGNVGVNVATGTFRRGREGTGVGGGSRLPRSMFPQERFKGGHEGARGVRVATGTLGSTLPREHFEVGGGGMVVLAKRKTWAANIRHLM